MSFLSFAGKRPARLKWPVRIGVALLLYTLVGFFVVPAIIKSQMLKRLPALTLRQAAVEQVRFNPYALSLTIRGFSLKETNGDVFSSFDEFYINFQPIASIFKRGWVFSEISLKKPFAQVTYEADGTFNFSNLLTNSAPTPSQPKPPSSQPQTLPRVVIYQLSVTNGEISIADLKRAMPFHTQFTPIDLNLTNLTTIRDRNSPYRFMARTGSGESFAWAGTVTVNPLRSDGTFRLGGLNLPKYATYAHDYATCDIANGGLDVAADYRYDSVTNALDLVVSNAAVHLSNLEIKAPDTGEMMISIPHFDVTGTEASVARQTARVGLVKSSDGSLLVRRNQDGTINLLAMLKLPTNAPVSETSTPAPSTNAPAQSTNAAPAWVAHIDEIAIENYAFKIQDKALAKPASFNIDQLALDLKGVSNVTNTPVTASLSLRFQETGSIAVNGTATLMPPWADLQLALTNVDLRPIEPYVAEQAKVAITGGAVDLQGRARYASTEPGAPLVNFTGSLAVNKLGTSDGVMFKDLIKWDALAVDGIKLDMQPDKLQVDQVKFTGLSASVVIGPDHKPALMSILPPKPGTTNASATNVPAETAATTSSAAAKKLPDVALGALVLENASIHFSDQSIEPHCSFDVQEFGGTIQGISSQDQAIATIDMKGKVDERSPFSISGKLSPLAKDLYADVTIAFTNTELTAFTPYSEKFAGRPLQKGKLSLSLHYLIQTNALKAENNVYVDQLTLGAKNNSPDATSLPVKLAIALLKDRNGRIQLDVPVQGRLDDPKFAVGPIIWHVVLNLITKAATSPFSLLGAMFGGGEEMSFVEFQPGYADVPLSETNKLETLAEALYERPALSVEVTGSVDPATDRIPLARVKLEDQLKSMYVKELTDAGKPAIPLDQVKLDPDTFERLLKRTYHKTIGSYEPTKPSTNQISGGGTNIAAQLAALPPEEITHGASLLENPTQKKKKAGKPAPGASPSAQLLKPLTRSELELADMEDQLVQKIEITNDDLRDLMQQRAKKVQAYLLKTGKVTDDRVFVIAPKAIDESFKGEDRVNLSLD